MCQLHALADDDLCHREYPLNSQSIGYWFDSLLSWHRCLDAIVRKLSADWLMYATLQHFVATDNVCQDMTCQLLCQQLLYRVRAGKD